MVMAHAPGLVDLESGESASPARAKILYDPEMKYPHRVEEASATGQWGDPRAVSPSANVQVDALLGRQLIDACGDRLAKKFGDLLRTVAEGVR
jgi:hypothetical protein